MPFVARNRAQIRASLLSDWQSRYAGANPPQLLNIFPGSDAYILADGIGLECETVEAQAAALTYDLLPDQADTAALNRWGYVHAVARNPALPWTGLVKLSGTPGTTVTFGTSVLTYNGISYGSFEDQTTGAAITSVPLSVGGGVVGVRVTANIPGSITSLPDGAVLTWSSTPGNAVSTATVPTALDIAGGGTLIAGQDQEPDASYAQRIIEDLRNRAASGNRAHWRVWVAQYTGILNAYVYPLLQSATGATGVPGCVTVVPMGPVASDATGAQNGDNPVNSRIVGPTEAALVYGFIEGNNDATGVAPALGVSLPQLRPVTMSPNDYTVVAPTPVPTVVEIQALMRPATPFPFAYSATDLVLASPAPTNTTWSIAGNQTSRFKAGGVVQPLIAKLLNGTSSVIRGNYYRVVPSTVVYDGTNTNFTFTAGFPGTAVPVVGSVLCPALPAATWQTVRLAVFKLFDGLGPGDTLPPSRWPEQGVGGASTLFQTAPLVAVIDQIDSQGRSVSGYYNAVGVFVPISTNILNGNVIQPAGNVVPPPLSIVTLSDLFVHP